MRYQTLIIYRPTISKKITQGWGENRACVGSDGRVFGVSTVCPAGSQSFYSTQGMIGHNGIDIATITGEEVYHSGTYDGWLYHEVDSMGGIGVDIVSNEPLFFPFPIPTELINSAVPFTQDGIPGFIHHVKMRNWHLSKGIGHEKKQVTCGTVVGLAGNTGASSGPHLHFAPKWCLADGRGLASNNGYYGAFDPTPFYNHEITAADHAKYMRTPVVPLTPIEQKDKMAQLSNLKQLLLTLQKLIHNI